MYDDTEKLIRYLEGELSENEATEVEARLRTDEAYQAEHLALKRVDQLLGAAPMAAPPADFMARFESRLERRLKHRRNTIGLTMISIVLVMAAGLLFWSFAGSGLSLLSWLSGVNVSGYIIDLLPSVLRGVGIVFRVGALMVGTVFQLVKHPIFWGYILLVAGLISLWAQLLKWVGLARPPASA